MPANEFFREGEIWELTVFREAGRDISVEPPALCLIVKSEGEYGEAVVIKKGGIRAIDDNYNPRNNTIALYKGDEIRRVDTITLTKGQKLALVKWRIVRAAGVDHANA